MYSGKSVLITQGELATYAGSEIVTLELAEYFSQMGARVHILASHIADPIKADFEKLEQVFLHTNQDEVDCAEMDIVWIHHQLIPTQLVSLAAAGALKARVLFNHMSPFHPLEFPTFATIEQKLANVILYNSKETKQTIEEKLADVSFKGVVFPNPAPERFFMEGAGKSYSSSVQKVLIVTNHMSQEMEEAAALLRSRGLEVRHIGRDGGEVARVQPIDILDADIVITIGKTVQYALMVGTPVYCYDHFGGPGYLAPQIFSKCAEHNFSGRAFSKKTAQEITNEIIQGYKGAVKFAKSARTHYAKTYTLPAQLSKVLVEEMHGKGAKDTITQTDMAILHAAQMNFWDTHRALKYYVNEANTKSDANEKLYKELQETKEIINDLTMRLSEISNSTSWKSTAPLRAVSGALKGEFNSGNATQLKRLGYRRRGRNKL